MATAAPTSSRSINVPIEDPTTIISAMVDQFVARGGGSSATGGTPPSGASSALLTIPSPSSKTPAIDYQRERYPFCIVWTPLPLITWIFPFIGHMGICDSRGVIHDFAGPYFISRDNMAFGNPTKYWYLFPDHVAKELITSSEPSSAGDEQKQLADAVRRFDKGIVQTTEHFRKTQMYNLFCNNCHSFVAHCLIAGERLAQEEAGATPTQKKNRTWNMVTLTIYLFFFGRYVSWGRFLISHVPFLIFVIIVASIGWGASAATKNINKT